ncbi:MAG: hypothetical protein J6Y99_02285 [Bacteroidales bacterium]|nr:hypothetical protein [Bacteroidales bacterium]
MKKNIIHLSAFFVLLAYSISLTFANNKNSFQTPDFNFPQEVEANARPVLEKALRTDDQNKAVRATLQICESRLFVSDHNINSVMTFIDSVCNVGKLTPDYRALFYVYESKAINRLNNFSQTGGDDESDDISLWSSVKRDSLENALLSKALDPLENGDISPLLTSITKFKGIVNSGNKWGQRSMPYLYDLAAKYKSERENYEKNVTPDQKKDFKQQWLSVHTKDKDLYATIYIEKLFRSNDSQDNQKGLNELIEKYKDKEEVGLLYCNIWNELPPKDYITICKRYLEKFPNSPFASQVKSRIEYLDIIENRVTFPKLISSTDSLQVKVSFTNFNTARNKISIYRVPQELNQNHSNYNLKELELVDEQIVEKGNEGETKTIYFKPFPYGIYYLSVAIESPKGDWSAPTSFNKYYFRNQIFTISDIRSFVINSGDESSIFAINAADGKPLSNVTVNRYIDEKTKPVLLGTTNNNGCYIQKQDKKDGETFHYSLSLEKDKYLGNPFHQESCYVPYYWEREQGNPIQGQIFTDLAIYRPGDSLRASIVLYNRTATERKLLQEKLDWTVELLDNNWKEVESLTLTNDVWGQIKANFKIPTDRMNGTFHLVVLKNKSMQNGIPTKNIEVSEYKAPTFYIDLSDTKKKQAKREPITIKGKVMTFNGLPVANREVFCESNLQIMGEHNQYQSFTTQTDEQGNFEHTNSLDWTSLENEYFCYSIKAVCTNEAGETHESSTYIMFGKSRSITLSEKEFLLSYGEAAHLPIQFESTDNNETEALCEYSLQCKESGKIVKNGIFSTSLPDFDWDQVPSGCYIFKASIQGDNSACINKEIILFRASDTSVPNGIKGLWIPQGMQSVTPEGMARILIGNGKPCHIYYIAQSRVEIIEKKWIEYPAGLHWFEFPMPKGKDEKLTIDFFNCIDGKIEHPKVTLLSPDVDEIHLKAITFRDKVTPGSKQHWTLQLTDSKDQPLQGRLMMDIYDMALEKLQSNNWTFKPTYFEKRLFDSRLSSEIYENRYITAIYPLERKWIKSLPLKVPFLLFNDMRPPVGVLNDVVVVTGASGNKIKNLGRRLASKVASATRSDSYSGSGDIYGYRAMNAEAAAVAPSALDNISVRTSKTHVALWRPTLTSDQEGNFQIEFDVPDDNTTWCMQALAFSRTMATCLMQKEILAQRTLMVQPSLPRFLRSGDKTQLKANVQNAADSAVKAVALVELFDPRTDKVLKSKKFNLQIAANGTEVVGIECEAPLDEPYIGFRVKVVDGQGNGDGEQQKLPVLPSTSMVTEGQPFFLTAGQGSVVLDVHRPSAGKSHSVLMACSNPTWYCISALPSIANTDLVTSTGLAHNLFALGMAASLVKNEPALDKVSRLRQDEDLKITTLQASPWTRAADQQEKRMQALSRLLNPEQNRADYNALMDKLLTLQKKDGGFGWFDNPRDTTASYWATSTVLQLMGRLRMLGCLPEEEKMSTAFNKALQYMDKEVMDNLKDDLLETGKVNVMYYADYAYICSLYDKDRPYKSAAIKLSTNLLRNKILSAMEKNWRKESLLNRAYCAVTLQRFGHEKEAQRIVESLKQLAINDKDKGMYWEKLPDGFWSHPVAHTATILEAMNEVAPEQYAVEIERVRQWLLLEKQTSDWGGSSLAADAVYALLRTGGDWLHAEVDTTPLLQIKIDGKPVDYEALNQLLGNMRMDLPADARQVEVIKSENHPAWGAVVHQYEAPMQEIKKQGVKELTLRKELWVQDDKGEWLRLSLEGKKGTQLRLGQKVQVRLIITCTKALEYLTLTDERPASLEPVDQLSHYGWGDCSYYQETKDSQTNFFIRRLPEGSYTLTYDCHVTNIGSFSVGIATIQSQYAPQFVAHSAGGVLLSR